MKRLMLQDGAILPISLQCSLLVSPGIFLSPGRTLSLKTVYAIEATIVLSNYVYIKTRF